MRKLPRVLDLKNRLSCNIVVPNRGPLFPIFLAPGVLNGANTVSSLSHDTVGPVETAELLQPCGLGFCVPDLFKVHMHKDTQS